MSVMVGINGSGIFYPCLWILSNPTPIVNELSLSILSHFLYGYIYLFMLIDFNLSYLF